MESEQVKIHADVIPVYYFGYIQGVRIKGKLPSGKSFTLPRGKNVYTELKLDEVIESAELAWTVTRALDLYDEELVFHLRKDLAIYT